VREVAHTVSNESVVHCWGWNPSSRYPAAKPGLEGIAGLRERIAALDLREQLVCSPQELASFLGVSDEGRARDVERTEPVELEDIERRDRPRTGPKETSRPRGARHRSDPSNVSLPTESNTTGTPFRSVSAMAASAKSSFV
jgi:hypothetical protein